MGMPMYAWNGMKTMPNAKADIRPPMPSKRNIMRGVGIQFI